MFNDLEDIRAAVRSDLSVSSNSSLYPQATIDRAINRAYVKASKLFRWPVLEDAKYTTTQANQQYYDAPTTWMPDSIWRVSVDGVQYGVPPAGRGMVFSDFLTWKEDYPDSTDKRWAVQWLRLFLSPTPTSAGLELAIWGMENVETLSADGDTTIFSGSMPDCNEAIALEAAAILKKKGTDPDKGGMFSGEAKQMLAVGFSHLQKEQSKYDKNLPFFDVPNYYRTTGAAQVTGNFTNTQGLDL